MPVKAHRGTGSVEFSLLGRNGATDFPVLSIWDDGEVILESSYVDNEYIYPTLEEWEFLAQIVATNIARLRKENPDGS